MTSRHRLLIGSVGRPVRRLVIVLAGRLKGCGHGVTLWEVSLILGLLWKVWRFGFVVTRWSRSSIAAVRGARLVLGRMTVCKPYRYVVRHPSQLSLAIPSGVGGVGISESTAQHAMH